MMSKCRYTSVESMLTVSPMEVSVDHKVLRRTGIRNLEKKFRSIAQIAADPSVLSVASSLLGKTPRPVRALFFDKNAKRKWIVT